MNKCSKTSVHKLQASYNNFEHNLIFIHISNTFRSYKSVWKNVPTAKKYTILKQQLNDILITNGQDQRNGSCCGRSESLKWGTASLISRNNLLYDLKFLVSPPRCIPMENLLVNMLALRRERTTTTQVDLCRRILQINFMDSLYIEILTHFLSKYNYKVRDESLSIVM